MYAGRSINERNIAENVFNAGSQTTLVQPRRAGARRAALETGWPSPVLFSLFARFRERQVIAARMNRQGVFLLACPTGD